MSLCPLCNRMSCDHEPEERGQTFEEMIRPLTPDEEKVVIARNNGDQVALNVALATLGREPENIN